jgi:cytochrome c556
MKIFLVLIIVSSWANAQPHNHGPGNRTPDLRKPLPLLEFMAEHQKQNMREHLEVIRDLMGGLAKKDFKIIKQASQRLGSSPQMNMMCNHIGQGAPGFTPMALKMHTEADKIIVAADNKDLTAVMVATERTLQSCTNCHAAYKQQIVSEQEWNKILNKK